MNYYSPPYNSPQQSVSFPRQPFVSPNSSPNREFPGRSYRGTPPYIPRTFSPRYSENPSPHSPRMFNNSQERQRNSYAMRNSWSPNRSRSSFGSTPGNRSYGMRNSWSPNQSNISGSNSFVDSSFEYTPGSNRRSSGRAYNSGDANPGHCSNIAAYVKPSMLEDPWIALEQKLLNKKAELDVESSIKT